MKYKYSSRPSDALLAYMHDLDVNGFDYPLAYKALPHSKPGAVRQLLSDLTKRGLLMRLKDGKFYIVPNKYDVENFMPDWHVLAEHLVGGVQHYVGYYSALQMHQLTTQPSSKEQIVVSKQMRPSTIIVNNVPFQFIYHNEKHFFGAKSLWVDNFNKVLCSDLEKTIIDCLFKPEYSAGIPEIAKAIYISKDNIKYNILLDYLKRFDSQAVIKRLGFLLELLEIKCPIIQELQQMKTASYVMLDTELPKSGKYLSRWSIQQNLDSETIKSAIYT